ncbi:IS6 family transposase [Candidatus Woesearchaeota archaeon]|nr:IS6 family transposase [Candidatus Woesearchaeota archaeon]
MLHTRGIQIAKQSVNEWIAKWQEVMGYIQTTPKKARKVIAIDETKIKINGKWAFLWCAADVNTRELIAIEVSWLRNGAVAIWFIKDVLTKCKNKKKVCIITDGAGWYPWACRLLHIKHKEVHGGKRNYVERFNRTFKDKVKDKINAWSVWYNNIRYHNGIRGVPCLT